MIYLFQKHIRQVIPSTRFSVVTALCEVYDFYICSTNQFYNAAFLAIYIQNPFTIVLALH